MLAMVLYIITEVVATNCPHHCECIWRDGKDAALCAGASFTKIPNDLLATTQLLDISDNPLTTIRDYVFNDTGLLNLQRLYLTSSDVNLVEPKAFWGLINLVELDLSKNKLNRVPSRAFYYIPGLRELKLSNNPIMRINKEEFQYLADLVRLSLKSCRIMEIEPRGFFGLERSLQYLELSHNHLRVLNVSVLAPLRALKDVTLHNNPWNCTCLLRPMRDWMIKRNVPITITPECAYPFRLRSRQWIRIDINEFACYPKLTTAPSSVRGSTGDDVVLTCRVSATPVPRIRWYRMGRLLSNTSVNSAAGRYYIILNKNDISSLTVKSAEQHDSGTYSCVSENEAGSAEAVVNVTINGRGSFFGQHNIVAWFIIVAVIALCSCGIGFYMIKSLKKIRLDISTNEGAVSYRNDQARIYYNDKRDVETDDAREMMSQKRGDYQNVPSHDPEDVAGSDRVRFGPIALDYQAAEHDARNYRDTMRDNNVHTLRTNSVHRSLNAASTLLTDDLKTAMKVASNSRESSKSRARARHNNFSYSHISMTENEKNYPDLIEKTSFERQVLSNEAKHESHYFTTRRKKGHDSSSPLIDTSRRSSSGEDSVNYYDRYNKYQLKSWQRRSNSSCDLSAGSQPAPRPSLPGTPVRHRRAPSATPLLDVNSLMQYSRTSYSTSDEFENQVLQMASFLNEYRSIGSQLFTSPKETKNSLQRSRPIVSEESFVRRGKHSVAGLSAAALPDAASPLTLNAAELEQSAPEMRASYLN